MKWYQISGFFQFMTFSISTLIPLYWRQQLGYDEYSIGVLNAIAVLIAVFAPIYFSHISNRYRPGRIVYVCFLVNAGLALAFLIDPSFLAQTIIYALFQTFRWGYFILVPVGVMYLLHDSPGKRYGRYRRVGSLGFLLGVIGAGYLSRAYDSSAIFYPLFLANLAAAYPFMAKIDMPVAHPTEKSYRDILRQPVLVYFFVGTAISSVWYSLVFVFLPLRLDAMGASNSDIGWIVSLCGVLALFTMSKVGRFTDRFSTAKLYLIVPVFAALRLFCMYLPERHWAWFILIQMLHIPTWVLADILQIKFIRENCPPELLTKAQALLHISMSVGTASGSALSAVIAGEFGLRQVFLYLAPIPLISYFFLARIPKLVSKKLLEKAEVA